MQVEPQGAGIEAESAVLGSILRSPLTAAEVLARLRAEDFVVPRHRELFGVIAALETKSIGSSDAVTVRSDLEARGKYEALGGDDFFLGLMESVPSAAYLINHVIAVKSASKRRRLREVVRLASTKLEGDFETDAVARELDLGINDLLAAQESSTPITMSAAVKALQEDLKARITQAEAKGQVPSPVGLLNSKLGGGFYPPELIVVGARPGMGKTIFAECCAERASQHGRVLFVTLEMDVSQLAERGVRRHIQADIPRLKKLHGALAEQALEHTGEASRILSQQEISFLDDPGADFASIRSAAIRMKRDGGLALLIIDYLQLIPVSDPSGSRQEDISNLSRRFKLLAKELKVPVVLLSQLNRNSERRENKKPSLADLRESGAIEQDADIVILLHRPGYYDKTYVGPDDLQLEKNRHGASGHIEAKCNLERMRWSDYVQEVAL